MHGMRSGWSWTPLVLILAILLLTNSCVPKKPARTPQPQTPSHATPYAALSQTLVKVGKFAEDSFYACLMNGYAQGLPMSQVSAECATQVVGDFDGSNGLGGDILGAGGSDPFDPGSITANCAAGDPNRSQTYSAKPVGYPGSAIMPGAKVGGMEGYGYGTYGGKGMKDPEDGKEYIGLSKEESMRQKKEAMEAAQAALNEKIRLESAAKAETDPVRKKELEEQAKAAAKKWDELHSEASKDPNKKEPGIPNSRPMEEGSSCDQALQAAREVLRECNRNGWRSHECQSLAAKMNNCPDPALILVDPDAGYSCGAKVDPEAAKNAWMDRCESRVKYGPDGGNPCVPPTVNLDGRYVRGNGGDICSDPQALVDPDSGVCIAPIEVKPFGQPDIQQIIIIALDKIGGPIVILPNPNPSPRPGNDPRPGPR